jgi:hypothetical protein
MKSSVSLFFASAVVLLATSCGGSHGSSGQMPSVSPSSGQGQQPAPAPKKLTAAEELFQKNFESVNAICSAYATEEGDFTASDLPVASVMVPVFPGQKQVSLKFQSESSRIRGELSIKASLGVTESGQLALSPAVSLDLKADLTLSGGTVPESASNSVTGFGLGFLPSDAVVDEEALVFKDVNQRTLSAGKYKVACHLVGQSREPGALPVPGSNVNKPADAQPVQGTSSLSGIPFHYSLQDFGGQSFTSDSAAAGGARDGYSKVYRFDYDSQSAPAKASYAAVVKASGGLESDAVQKCAELGQLDFADYSRQNQSTGTQLPLLQTSVEAYVTDNSQEPKGLVAASFSCQVEISALR